MREDRVGRNLPSAEDRQKLLADLKDIRERIKTWGLAVPTEQRKSWDHPRDGYEPHLSTVMALSRKYEVKVRGLPQEDIETDETVAKAVGPLAAEGVVINQILSDTYGQARSEMWTGFRAYYKELQAKAKNDPELAEELKPVKSFMAEPSRKARAGRRGGAEAGPPA
jgi:hypothetical protein